LSSGSRCSSPSAVELQAKIDAMAAAAKAQPGFARNVRRMATSVI
jgi:hypothetical protein